jgi:hypothetical protein
MTDPRGWEAAAALRWKLASGALLDPFSLVGAAAAAWAAWRAAGAWVGGDPVRAAALPLLVLGGLAAVATAVAAALLYERRENELLRSLPLGPGGFLRLCRRELGWWMTIPGAVAAMAVGGGSGAPAGALVLVGGLGAREAGLLAAVGLGARGRRLLVRAATLGLFALGAALWMHPPSLALPAWAGALAAGVAGAAAFGARPLADRLWPRLSARRLSDAVARPRGAGPAWGALLDRALPLPGPWRARLLRDLLLLVRGEDPRALLLLGLSPLACVWLVGELARPGNAQALTWRVLTASALGGAAVAYAAGPATHLLRARALGWERVAVAPGRRHLGAALAWSLGAAFLHGGGVLLTVAFALGGRHADLVPGLALPVLGLEAALAWFVAAFVAGATDGRRVLGEGSLAIMLPVVALGVALVGLLAPWAVPLYFLLTADMVRQGVRRIDTLEVAW